MVVDERKKKKWYLFGGGWVLFHFTLWRRYNWQTKMQTNNPLDVWVYRYRCLCTAAITILVRRLQIIIIASIHFSALHFRDYFCCRKKTIIHHCGLFRYRLLSVSFCWIQYLYSWVYCITYIYSITSVMDGAIGDTYTSVFSFLQRRNSICAN